MHSFIIHFRCSLCLSIASCCALTFIKIPQTFSTVNGQVLRRAFSIQVCSMIQSANHSGPKVTRFSLVFTGLVSLRLRKIWPFSNNSFYLWSFRQSNNVIMRAASVSIQPEQVCCKMARISSSYPLRGMVSTVQKAPKVRAREKVKTCDILAKN